MRSTACLLVAVVFGCAPVVRADDWPVLRGPAHDPAPFTLDAKYLAGVPKDFFDDAPACILFTRTAHLIENDGTVTTVVHEITRFNGRKGIEKLGEYHSIYFNPRHDKVTLNEARVLKADGTKVPVEPRHVQLRDTATDYQVYDDSKQLVISWPNLQVGDAYEVKWTVRSKDPEFGGEFFSRYNLGDDDLPVARDELLVRVPKGRPLKHAAINGKLAPVVTERDGAVTYLWQVRHKQPLPRDDERPSKEELRCQIAFSTFSSWAAVGRWKQKARKECWECTDAIKQVVAKVAGREPTPLAKARALTYWVRQNIRYLSRGPEGMGYTPHAPAAVFANRFGDCKDQAQILAVMLRAVGLRPWLVTLGTLDDGQVRDDVPSPWGTHAIVMVALDGKEHWIDTTVSQAAWDYLPRSDCGRRVYLARDGVVRLATTPALSHDSYRIEQMTQVTVAPDGTSRNRRTIAYHGTGAWTKRDAWLDTPAGERRRLIASELQEANTRSRLVRLKVDEQTLHHHDGPVRAEIDFETPDHFSGDAREGLLSDNVVWTRLLAYTLDPTRTVPFELPTPFESIHRFVVQLPPALRVVQMPEEKRVASGWGFLDMKVIPDPADAHRFEIVLHTRLTKTRVEKPDFAAFQRFHDDVNKAYRFWLSLRPTHEWADAPALEALVAKAPQGELYSAQVLARLYLDNERRADASRVLALTLKHHPDETALWEMRLQATTDLAETEALYRAMIVQFPKEPRHVVALGANLARRGKHAEARQVLLPLTGHEKPAVRGAAHYQLARVCDRQGDHADALKHLKTAATADPTLLIDVKAVDFKARLHTRLGQFKEAIATYQTVLELDDKLHDVLDRLVRLEWQAGKKSDALDHLRRYTVAVGKDTTGLINAAELHLLVGRPDDALDLVSRIGPDQRTRAVNRVQGLAHLRKGEYKPALKLLQDSDASDEAFAGRIEAGLAVGDLRRARLALRDEVFADEEYRKQARRLRRALALREMLLKQAPEAVGGSYELDFWPLDAAACALLGIEEGWPRKRLEPLVELSCAAIETTKLAPALALRAWLALERGELTKALADADKAIAMTGADARAYLVRGRVRLERGHAKALDDLERAASLSARRDATVLHWLAVALAKAGRSNDAIETLQQALRLRPGDAELVSQLRALEAKRANVNK